jgi:hypothetical protein
MIVAAAGLASRPQDSWAESDVQKALHMKCIEASHRAEADAAAIVPGRSWTWRLDFERSREELAQLRDDFTSLHDCESKFEASLTAKQKIKVEPQLRRLASLWNHLQKDAQSLDLELQKGYPTRWHVAHDATDMQRETSKWRRLHDQVARTVGAGS